MIDRTRYAATTPLAFGCARRSFSCGGYLVPEGWRVYLALSLRNRDAAVWRAPESFDPARFAPETAGAHKPSAGLHPPGCRPATGHQCLGLEYSTILTLVFLVLLVRDCEWDVPPQDLSYRWNTIPPEPRDGLRVRLGGAESMATPPGLARTAEAKEAGEIVDRPSISMAADQPSSSPKRWSTMKSVSASGRTPVPTMAQQRSSATRVNRRGAALVRQSSVRLDAVEGVVARSSRTIRDSSSARTGLAVRVTRR